LNTPNELWERIAICHPSDTWTGAWFFSQFSRRKSTSQPGSQDLLSANSSKKEPDERREESDPVGAEVTLIFGMSV
jgi:hypothetical protein